MSVSNPAEAELKELVAKTLEEKGVLGKVKAQLRASVFLALQEQDTSTKFPLNNEKIRSFISSQEGKLTVSLVMEFLDYFELDSSKAVFEVEASCGVLNKARKSLLEELPGISESEASGCPLLSTMIKKLKQQPLPSFPVQNFAGMHLSKPEDFLSTAPKTESLSGKFNGTSVSAEGKTLGGLKEDFGKMEFPGNDSVRRVLDFNKTTSFPPAGTDMNKKLTSGDISSVDRREELTDPKLLVTHPPNPKDSVNTFDTQLIQGTTTTTNDYEEDFYSEDDGSIHTSSVSSEHSEEESQTMSSNKLETTDHTINLSQSTDFDIAETINT
ncbi:centrosomal protein 43-like [Dysidea avara]|uniref:centrosomal protein 43-like n=1 Tax=Dysidea avara TaxID=196820 RepID=UPI00332A3A33